MSTERGEHSPGVEKIIRKGSVPGIVKRIDDAAFKLFGHHTGRFASGLRPAHVQAYASWEEVRVADRQPKFRTASGKPHPQSTGLEGWYVEFPPEEAVASMLDIGTAALEHLSERYGIGYAYHFLRVLKGEVEFDPQVMRIATDLFFAVKDAAIEQTEETKEARDAFREKTKELVAQNPSKMSIIADANNVPIEQEIQLPLPKVPDFKSDTADLTLLLNNYPSKKDKMAWDMLATLGVVGYPYIRLAETTDLFSDIQTVMNDSRRHKPRTLSWADKDWDGTIDVYKMMGYEGPEISKIK